MKNARAERAKLLGATGREHVARQGSGVSQIFILIISNGEKILSTVNVVCEDKLDGKTAHLRLPSASPKRACLSCILFLPTEYAHF